MTTHEYFKRLGIKPESYIDVAFMVAEVVGESFADKKFVYYTTPRRAVADWYSVHTGQKPAKILDWPILNTEVYDIPWLSGCDWNPAIKSRRMMMILVTPFEEICKYYGEKQAKGTIEYISQKIQEGIENGSNPWIQK